MEGNSCQKSPTALAPEQTRCWGGLSLSALPIVAVVAKVRGVTLDMSRIHPECPDSDPSDRLVAADVLLRQVPDKEEDEDEDEGDRKEDDEDEGTDDGYSV